MLLPHLAVGHKEVEAPVVVEVFKARRPGPVGGGETGKERGLLANAGTGVQEKRAAHVLRRHRGVLRRVPEAGTRVSHAALILLVCGRRHVGHEKIDESVVVHVAEVRPHRGKRRVRHHEIEGVGEGAVPVVVI